MTTLRRLVLLGMLVAVSAGAGFGLAALNERTEKRAVLRIGELPGSDQVVEDGPVSYQVLGWRCGLVAVSGDHADFLADGQYCRVRLRVVGQGLYVSRYEAVKQRLVDSSGRMYRPEQDAMHISDQPLTLDIARHAAYEFDIWFDVPPDADVEALLVRTSEGGVRPRTSEPASDGARLDLPS